MAKVKIKVIKSSVKHISLRSIYEQSLFDWISELIRDKFDGIIVNGKIKEFEHINRF